MSSYKELQEQIAGLQKKAEQARAQEMDGARSQIKALMKQYWISVADLSQKSPGQKKQRRESLGLFCSAMARTFNQVEAACLANWLEKTKSSSGLSNIDKHAPNTNGILIKSGPFVNLS